MYRNSYQSGLLTILKCGGADPLVNWDIVKKDGYLTRFLDQDIKSMVIELRGTNVSTTYIVCPKGNQVLGIYMPFLIMIVKNLKKYFSFEVTILDDTNTRRRFRVSNFQSGTQILPLFTVMPIGLSEGWNQIQFNLAEFTRRAYQKQFVEVQKVKINANIRLRRVYFAERLIPEDELPTEYKIFFPLQGKKPLKSKSNEKAEASKPEVQELLPAQEETKEVMQEVSGQETQWPRGRSGSIVEMPSRVSPSRASAISVKKPASVTSKTDEEPLSPKPSLTESQTAKKTPSQTSKTEQEQLSAKPSLTEEPQEPAPENEVGNEEGATPVEGPETLEGADTLEGGEAPANETADNPETEDNNAPVENEAEE